MAACAQCGKREGQRDGLCPACRLPARRYHWPEPLRAELLQAYGLPRAERIERLRVMAARMGWPQHVLRNQASRMGLAKRTTAGSRIARRRKEWRAKDVQTLFRVSRTTIWSWYRRGLFGRVDGGRVSAEQVIDFATRHRHEYDLAKVDQVLYKALVFGG